MYHFNNNFNMKNKNKSPFFYFKVTFLSISAGLFVGLLIYGLLDVNFSEQSSIVKWLSKSLIVAVGTGLVLGILNMFFKVSTFHKKED